MKIAVEGLATSGLSRCHGESHDVHMHVTASQAQTSWISRILFIMAESISIEEIRNAMSAQKLKQLDLLSLT